MRKFWAGVILIAVVASLVAVLVIGGETPDYYNEERRIAVVRIEGLISSGAGTPLLGTGVAGSEGIARQLERLAEDPTVGAVILRLDSPGGTVAAGHEIAAAVDFVRDSGKVVVASMGNMAASSAYWIASRCNSIVAAPTTTTGSIGVIIQTTNLRGLYEKLGVDMEVIKSGPLKDMGSSNRPMNPTERDIFQNMVDDMFNQFVDAVADGRNMSREDVLAVADGRVLTGRQAYALGLVDRLGFFRDAVDEASELAGLRDPEVFEAGLPSSLTQFFGGIGALVPRVSPVIQPITWDVQ